MVYELAGSIRLNSFIDVRTLNQTRTCVENRQHINRIVLNSVVPGNLVNADNLIESGYVPHDSMTSLR